jgi:CMP/dCMP kinase
MIITLSGTSGAGKTTIANRLVKELGLNHYYMGGIRRKVAKERGMTLDEFNKLGEKDPSTDKMVDDYLVKLGKTEDDFIAEGRTAAYFIPNSVKLYLKCNFMKGAERILTQLKTEETERNEDISESVEQKAEELKKRLESDKLRYMKFYGVDVYDESMYDFVLDTTDLTKEEAYQNVLDYIKSRQK